MKKSMIRLILFATPMLCVVLMSKSAYAQFQVIVNKSNERTVITRQELIDIYSGNYLTWENNSRVAPVSLKSTNTVTAVFFEKTLNRNVVYLKKIWLKLSLSGKANPPKVMARENDVIQFVAANPGAIGFVTSSDEDDNVKPLTILQPR